MGHSKKVLAVPLWRSRTAEKEGFTVHVDMGESYTFNTASCASPSRNASLQLSFNPPEILSTCTFDTDIAVKIYDQALSLGIDFPDVHAACSRKSGPSVYYQRR